MEDQSNKPAEQPTTGGDINQVIKNDTNSNIKKNNDVIATTSTQPTTSSTATSLPLTAPSVSSALPPTTTIYQQQPPQKPRIIERPPINPNLKISIIRTTNDSVSCLDPNRPGKIKMIFMDQLKADNIDKSKDGEGSKCGEGIAFPGGSHPQSQNSPRKENMIDGLARLHSLHSSTLPSTTTQNNTTTSKNKKEIPVPTITTSSTYNAEIPPTYNIPTSYIRYISPSYNEIQHEDVEYNVNSVDELWLFENLDFGPNAMARIVMPNESGSCGENGVNNDG